MIIAALILAILSIFIALVAVNHALVARKELNDYKQHQTLIDHAITNSIMYLLQKDGVFNGANGNIPIVTNQVGLA